MVPCDNKARFNNVTNNLFYRDRLKDKHKKNELIKLKRALGSSGTSSLDNSMRINGGHIVGTVGGKDNFFDD